MTWPLVGATGRLWLYERETFPRDTLYLLWRMVEEARGAPLLFYPPGAEESTCGDLTEFVSTFSSPGRITLVAQSLGETPELMGMIWFDQLEIGRRANVNVFFRPAYYGPPVTDLARLALTWAFEALRLGSVWAFTPWATAGQLCTRMGFEAVATLPEFVLVAGTPTDIHVWRLRKEVFHG